MQSFELREGLLQGMDEKKMQCLEHAPVQFLEILKEKDPFRFSEGYLKYAKAQEQIANLHDSLVMRSNASLRSSYAGEISLPVPIPLLNQGSELIPCKGTIGSHVFQFTVSCGHWNKIRLLPIERASGYFDLLNHLSDLVPSKGKEICLFTYENGVNNSFEQFVSMGKSIVKNMREKPLGIGLYNASQSFVSDFKRALSELFDNELSTSICLTYHVFTKLATTLTEINPQLLWAHFAHSEGGLITETALTMLQTHIISRYFKTQLLVATYGPAFPTPKSYARMVINTYSSRDAVTYPLSKIAFLILKRNPEEYNIRLVQSISNHRYNLSHFSKYAIPIYGFGLLFYEHTIEDHSFEGETYQSELIKNIDEFRKTAPIYSGK